MNADDKGGACAASWREWSGGACPVRGDCLVEVRRRYASIIIDRADKFAWYHDLYAHYGADDIMSYRIVCAQEL